ncbi:MAG: hypothetical protein ABGZ35_12835, partial [Planctomycetaceae bacterium]
MKLTATIGLLLLIPGSCRPATAAEFAVVTGEHGYLLGDDGHVVATLPQMTVVDLIDQDGPLLHVTTSDGITGRIHPQLVHRSSLFSYITVDNSEVIRRALELVGESGRVLDEDPDQAV